MPVAVQAETLPTLDLRRFDAGGAERPRFLNKLLMAARNVGFFYLVGHGIENSLIRDVLSVSRRFFALPEKDKLAIEMVNSPHFRGYNRAGYRGKPDWREQVDIGPERPALPFDPAAPPWARLQGPNQWPAALSGVQADRSSPTRRKRPPSPSGVLRAFAAALEQPEDVFAPIYTPAPNQLIKIIRYPGRAADESDQGVGAHKDSGFVTLLLQDKVRPVCRSRRRRTAGSTRRPFREPSSSTSARFSNSPPTAICAPTSIASSRRRPAADRLSVAFFLGARLDADVPAPRAAAASRRAGARGDAGSRTIRSSARSARNYLKSRLRSHPDVARRHHADLLDPATASSEPASAY